MTNIIEVFLLAENRLLREALIRLLSRTNDIRIVGASAYSPDIDREIISARPHIVLVDSTGFGLSGATLISALRIANENLRFILVGVDPHQTTLLQPDHAVVVGCVLKDASALEVVSTIRAVVAGEVVASALLGHRSEAA